MEFKRPVKLLQVFRNLNVYGKDKKSFGARKQEVAWRKFESKSGYVRDGELFLPETVLQQPHFLNCDLLTLEVSVQESESEETKQCF